MVLIEDYIKFTITERQIHLDLNNNCIERGGHSTKFQGILAVYLNTSIPSNNRNIHLCHACNNDKCSNPKHLYWGTCQDNFRDLKNSGKFKTGWQNTIAKYGKEEARRIINENFAKGKAAGGRASKGRKLSAETIKKRQDTRKRNKELASLA